MKYQSFLFIIINIFFGIIFAIDGPPVGLVNLGATCYMNATLQALYQIQPLTELVGEFYHEDYYRAKSIAVEYYNLIQDIKNPEKFKKEYFPRRVYEPEEKFCIPVFRDIFQITGLAAKSIHQDATEFLGALLNKLSETDISDIKDRENAILQYGEYFTTISAIFTSYIQSTLRYQGGETKKIEPNVVIGLSITNLDSLEKCLDQYFAQETVEYKPEGAHMPVEAQKQFSIVDSSPFLFLSLKRFEFGGGVGEKLVNPVSFPCKDLNLNKYFATKHDEFYDLFAIVQHRGALTAGHYTAYVKSNNQWWYCDDINVTNRTVEEIDNICKYGSDGSDFTPYVLFYKRRIGTTTKDIRDRFVNYKAKAPPRPVPIEKLRQELSMLSLSLQGLASSRRLPR